MRLTQNQAEKVVSYQESNSALRKELENVRDVVNKNKALMKTRKRCFSWRNYKQDFNYEGSGGNENHHEFELELDIIQKIRPDDEEVIKGCDEQRFVKKKAGPCRYIEVADSRFAGIVYEVNKK